MAKQRIAVIFGGASSEHEVSCVSASSVISNIPADDYEIICIGITKKGKWLFYPGEWDLIANGNWEKHPDCCPCMVSTDNAKKGIYKILDDQTVSFLSIDCFFPVLHGKNGEDGTIQGLFEMSMIPYVGCDTCSSAICMDKAYSHVILENAGIKMTPWILCRRSDRFRPEQIAQKVVDSFGFPVFVKPANAGSSVGVSKAKDENELEQAVKLAFIHDDKVLIEKAVTGIEVECAVLGNTDPEASVLGEIKPANEFYDYEAKYENAASELFIPARISQDLSYQVRGIAVEAFKAMGCTGLARVDFFVNPTTQEIFLNELNTMPGFTSISMYPKLWDATGVSYGALLDKLITLAMERAEMNG
ncbi:MAG: D-alanine--D-alanine ligase family protein [Candidatus Merdivicinus sp.]